MVLMKIQARTSFSIVSAAALIAFLGACAAKSPSLRIVPVPQPSYTITGQTVSIKGDSYSVELTLLDDAARAAYIGSRVPAAADPFVPVPGTKNRYLTFRLAIRNAGTKEPINFQPQSVVLSQESGERLLPFDFPQAYSSLAGRENTDPKLLEDLSKYMFDVGTTLAPGESIDRLLIFPAERLKTNRLRMEIGFLDPLRSSAKWDILFDQEKPR
jgi:hypothetical protein